MKKFITLVLMMAFLCVGFENVIAANVDGNDVGLMMYSNSITLAGDVRNGVVLTEVEVTARPSVTSISLLCILRKENDAGNYIIVDTWSDSAEGDYFFGEYSYSPAATDKKYELSVRVGIYDEDGFVGYDYETLSNID